MYLYLSNDNAALGGNAIEVFFDDFTVEHIKSPVVQQDDYYAFGLTFNSLQRENSTANKWKFQGQEHVTDLDLGWDSFKWRNHMPDIGRFFNVDPLAEKYVYNSPYAFSENCVTSHVELEGLEKANFNVVRFEANQGENAFRSPSTATHKNKVDNKNFSDVGHHLVEEILTFNVDLSNGNVSVLDARDNDKNFLVAFGDYLSGDEVDKLDYSINASSKDGQFSIYFCFMPRR